MSTTRHIQQRALDAEQFAWIEATLHPALTALPDKELADALSWLRERRDRARLLANRQRRSVRKKSDRPAGFDQADAGDRQKASILGEAVSRLNTERTRPAGQAKREAMVETASIALAARQAGKARNHPEPGRTQSKGFKPVDRKKAISPRERSFP